MEKVHWINVKMELQGISNEVKREIVIPDFFSLYYLHIVIASLFNFDDLTDVKIERGDVSLAINNDEENFNEEIFDEVKKFMRENASNDPFMYTYFGQDTWEVCFTLATSEKQYQNITCLKAVGNGIFFEQMTKDEYEKILEYKQNPNTESAKQFFQQFPLMQDLSFTAVDMQDIQYKLSLLERNLLDADEMVLPDEDMEPSLVTGSMPMLDTVFDTNSFLMYLYHEVAGLSIDQAAYEILYRTNIGHIIETMKGLGYAEETIYETLQTKLAFDEHVYEQVGDSIDLLHMLPQREEVFNEAEELYLEEIDALIFAILNEHQIDTTDLSTVDEQTEQLVSQQLVEKISALKNQHLS